MNARAPLQVAARAADTFVFASPSAANAYWMARALDKEGVVEAIALDPALVAQRISQHPPALLFVDFSHEHCEAASAVVAASHAAFPDLPVIAVGRLAGPESALAALRAGVRDFVDVAGDADDAQRIVRKVLDGRAEPVSRHGRLTVLLGARVGMGVTTLAANLGTLLARRGAARQRHTALLDLGLPAADGALLLNAGNGFSFVDAVRNLHRFDQTFVHTALARHESGLALLTLPAELGALQEISYEVAVALLARLRTFFDHQLVDLGGFTNAEFVAQITRSGDQFWIVCDQSVASIVSAARQLEALRENGVDPANGRLVLNGYEEALELSARQVAGRLGIELAGVLPARRLALCRAGNRGELLVDAMPRDPYVRALGTLAAQFDGEPARAPGRLDAFRRFLPLSLNRP
jgi:pilus assembly protein CpaE